MSYIKEKKQVFQETTVGYKCDSCGAISDGSAFGWFHFSHRHHGWGNDSIDSVEYFDVCSVDCFAIQLEKSIQYFKGERTAYISEMPIEFAKNLLTKIK